MAVLALRLITILKKYKTFFYVSLFLIIFIGYLFKPFTVFILDAYLSHGLGKKVEITSLNFFPFHFNGHISIKTYPKGINVHGKYTDKHLIMTTRSLGGLIRVKYRDYVYNTTVDSVDLVKFVELMGNKKYVQSGKINGTIFYEKRPRTGYTNLKVSNAVLHGLDLDKKLTTINDALQLNIQNIMSRTFLQDTNTSNITNIDHLQFNVTLKDNNITTNDFALRTERYRISVDANVYKKGPINHFHVSLIDKNGCSIITQKLKGDIRKPKVKHTSTAVVHVAKSVPSSIFGMGMKMMNYGSTYAAQQKIMPAENFTMPNKMILEADYYMQETSNIVMPLDCSIVYIGSVPHPLNTQTISKKSSMFHLP